MKCDYCGENVGSVISLPHPNGDIKILCFKCIESMDEEKVRAEGEPSKEKKSPI